MIAAPWYLLSAGCIVLVIGTFLARMRIVRGGDQPMIDPEMEDDEIANQLRAGERVPLAGWVIIGGVLLIMISLVWRLLRLTARLMS
jgi:hypothetical protein